jgi:two-component system, sensor histidine kinase PdtaS
VVEKERVDESWIRSLLGDWQLIADLAFSDLVLWVPKRNKLVAQAHARPAAAATIFYRDITGNLPRSDWEEAINQAWELGVVVVPQQVAQYEGSTTRVSAYPVYAKGADSTAKPVAIITKHTNLGEARLPNKLQLNFVAAGEQLLKMVATGEFPISEAGTAQRRGAPRANDGFVRLDEAGRVLFASPSALSIFNRAGVDGELEGRLFSETVSKVPTGFGTVDEGLPLVLTGKGAWRSDLEFEELTIAVRSVPLLENGKRIGAFVLCRDVSELRFRERELITKDATIREIHHRVKNNLQTVSSLLRIQSRQTSSEEVKVSLQQAQRRVSAIAVVHDVLSEGVDQEVPFDQIFKRILQLIPETTSSYHNTISSDFEGSFGDLTAERSTTLALVLTEIVANAVEHGIADRSGKISVLAERSQKVLHIEVVDDGVGLPEGKVGTGLGTQIVRTLVESELRGKISWTSPIRGGTKVVIDVPL